MSSIHFNPLSDSAVFCALAMRSAKDREINRRCKLACNWLFIDLTDDAANAASSSELAHEMGASIKIK